MSRMQHKAMLAMLDAYAIYTLLLKYLTSLLHPPGCGLFLFLDWHFEHLLNITKKLNKEAILGNLCNSWHFCSDAAVTSKNNDSNLIFVFHELRFVYWHQLKKENIIKNLDICKFSKKKSQTF